MEFGSGDHVAVAREPVGTTTLAVIGGSFAGGLGDQAIREQTIERAIQGSGPHPHCSVALFIHELHERVPVVLAAEQREKQIERRCW